MATNASARSLFDFSLRDVDVIFRCCSNQYLEGNGSPAKSMTQEMCVLEVLTNFYSMFCIHMPNSMPTDIVRALSYPFRLSGGIFFSG